MGSLTGILGVSLGPRRLQRWRLMNVPPPPPPALPLVRGWRGNDITSIVVGEQPNNSFFPLSQWVPGQSMTTHLPALIDRQWLRSLPCCTSVASTRRPLPTGKGQGPCHVEHEPSTGLLPRSRWSNGEAAIPSTCVKRAAAQLVQPIPLLAVHFVVPPSDFVHHIGLDSPFDILA